MTMFYSCTPIAKQRTDRAAVRSTGFDSLHTRHGRKMAHPALKIAARPCDVAGLHNCPRTKAL
jgi:hypothetical protein